MAVLTSRRQRMVIAGIALHSLLYAALFEDPFLWVAAAAAVAIARLAAPEPVPEA